VKTFYSGPTGWNERQLPDGTLIWTSPSGRTYTTTPAGALFFPQLAIPTGELVLPTTAPPGQNRGLAMPTADAPAQKSGPTESTGNAKSTTQDTPLTRHPSDHLGKLPITLIGMAGPECDPPAGVRHLSDVRASREPLAIRGGRPG
jgi:hypothetical protein